MSKDFSGNLENYFSQFRKNIIGYDAEFETPYGVKPLIYADWTASGRLYKPIEDAIAEKFGPFVGNTHTETTITGTLMTKAYHEAKEIIKRHVNASECDKIILAGSGMTGAIVKLQRILGLKIPEKYCENFSICNENRPVVFVTHMEHHSNHTSWIETIADVIIIKATCDGLVDVDHLKELLEQYKNRPLKIASVSACSNVTGMQPRVHQIASLVHKYDGYCFADYACSGPYVNINMHPENKEERLDAIFLSPHKFLGGPGTPGVLIFNECMYHNRVPDRPGGGTVNWTNPWNEVGYYEDIEIREDGGTPPFLQTIKFALCVKLKEKMGTENIVKREKEILELIFDNLPQIPGLRILEESHKDRLGVISFFMQDKHYNLIVKLLNDRFGIQMRGGCACAGTYGHFLYYIQKRISHSITKQIESGDLSKKPGWIRFSIHPTITNDELHYIFDALRQIAEKYDEWKEDYDYDPSTNEFTHKNDINLENRLLEDWLKI